MVPKTYRPAADPAAQDVSIMMPHPAACVKRKLARIGSFGPARQGIMAPSMILRIIDASAISKGLASLGDP
jgi:hypothetical protein